MPQARVGLGLLFLTLLAGCAGADVQGTEQLLAASGFAMEPGTTPQVQAELRTLPPHQAVMRPPGTMGAQPTYAYADPNQCRCVYLGSARNYQYYQYLLVQQQIADQNQLAAQMNEDAALQWSMPPPVIVVHEHHH